MLLHLPILAVWQMWPASAMLSSTTHILVSGMRIILGPSINLLIKTHNLPVWSEEHSQKWWWKFLVFLFNNFLAPKDFEILKIFILFVLLIFCDKGWSHQNNFFSSTLISIKIHNCTFSLTENIIGFFNSFSINFFPVF
jgi:hypothetical protein